MKRNQSVELLKLFAVFFVVIIHNSFASSFGYAMSAIARFSVPVFFMFTGYFIVHPTNTSLRLKKQIFKLAKFYIFYEFIYIAYDFVKSLLTSTIADFPNRLINNLYHILNSPTMGFQLWYIINIIYVLIIFYIFNHFDKLKLLFIISIILHLVGIIISNFSMQIFHVILLREDTRNFLFFGLFYVLLGVYIKKIDINKIKINKYFILLIAIALCLLQVFEKYLWHKLSGSNFAEYYFITIFACIALFIFVLKCKVNNSFVEFIAKYSMPIYFLHILVMGLLGLIIVNLMHINLQLIKNNIIGNFIFIFVVCILSCVLYTSTKRLSKLVVKMVKKLFRISRSRLFPS